MPPKLETLKQIPVFAQLSPPALEQLAALAYARDYDDGQLILLQEDNNVPVFFVIKGTVRVFRIGSDGREQTLTYLQAGEALNLPSAFLEQPAVPSSACAVGPAQLLTMSIEDLQLVISQTPEIALAVLKDLSEKLRHLIALTHDLSLLSVRSRLARFLLEQSEKGQNDTIGWTHEEIAAQIGTVREVVSRILNAFVRDGLIKLDRKQIMITDVSGLREEAIT